MKNFTLLMVLTLGFFSLFFPVHSQTWELDTHIIGQGGPNMFGVSMSLSGDGNTLIVGAPQYASGGAQGYAEVYELNEGLWFQKGERLIGTNNNDGFGHAVAISNDGNIIAISGPKNDGNGSNSGHVRIFQWDDNAWLQVGEDINGEFSADSSGEAIALNAEGSVLIIGATGSDDTGPFKGHARVFEWADTSWVKKGSDIDAEDFSEFMGEAVAINDDGSVVAVCGEGADLNQGVCRVYAYAGEDWIQQGSDLIGENQGDFFGHNTVLNATGDIIAVAAPRIFGDVNDPGYVKVYRFDGDAWQQMGATFSGLVVNNPIVTSIDVNSAGDQLVIGIPRNNNDTGKVSVYRWEDDSWSEMGQVLHGVLNGDLSGTAVNLSADGNKLSFTSPGFEAGPNEKGQISLYRFSEPSHTSDINNNCISVFPNPTKGAFTIYSDAGFSATDVSLFDMTGRLIWKVIISESHPIYYNINVKSGIYSLRINMNDRPPVVRKMIFR